MKRWFSLLAVFALLLTALSTSGVVFAANSDFEYTVISGKATVTAYNGSASTITIPSKLGGASVTAIGAYAFYNHTALKTVTIPSGVTRMDDSAFSGCTGLQTVNLPSTLRDISTDAFYNCAALKNITIPGGVETIGDRAFYYSDSLTSVTIPSSVKTIGNAAFEECSKLATISLPDSVTSIGADAFYYTAYYNTVSNWSGDVLYLGKHLLKAKDALSGSYTVRSGTKTVAASAFANAAKMTSVTFPSSVVFIGADALKGCASLTAIKVDAGNTAYKGVGNCLIETASGTLIAGCQTSVIPTDGSIKTIGDRAFFENTKLTSVTIPSSVKSIGERAFFGCIALKTLTMTNAKNVTVIGDEAFRGCAALNALSIPAGVESVGLYAFAECTGLTSIAVDAANPTYQSSGNCLIETAVGTVLLGCQTSVIPTDGSIKAIGDYAFYGTAVKAVTVPDGVDTIGANAFAACKTLASVTLPADVKTIGLSAFSGCTALRDVYFGGTQAQWTAVSIASGNGLLKKATMHFGGLIGDLNGDDALDMRDAFALYAAVSGASNLTSAQTAVSDMTGDGEVDMRDAFALYVLVSGG